MHSILINLSRVVAAIACWICVPAVFGGEETTETSILVEEPFTEADRDHWAFRPPERLGPPAVNNGIWVRNPIDRFILARLEQNGLQPLPPADRATLLRRVTFDLTGLPPTPEELAMSRGFLSDEAARLRAEGPSGEQIALLLSARSGVDPFESIALVEFCLAMFNLNEFVYVD